MQINILWVWEKAAIQLSEYDRDYFVYAPNQWEMTLQCNVVSHWLGAYTKRSLYHNISYVNSQQK